MKDSELLKEISNKLTALLAISFLNNSESGKVADRVRLLLRFSLSNQEIADIAGTTKRTVEVLKSRYQRK